MIVNSLAFLKEQTCVHLEHNEISIWSSYPFVPEMWKKSTYKSKKRFKGQVPRSNDSRAFYIDIGQPC